MDGTLLVVNGLAAAALVLAWGYLRRFQLNRPPLGAFNRFDVVVMLVALLVMLYLYLVLPAVAAAGFLALSMPSILSVALQPVLPRAWARWILMAGLLLGDVVLVVAAGAASPQFLIVNDLLLVIVVVGTAVLWAQGGMKARDLALLIAGVTIYDVFATTQASVMTDIARRLSVMPFVMRKAFNRTAGRVALGAGAVANGQGDGAVRPVRAHVADHGGLRRLQELLDCRPLGERDQRRLRRLIPFPRTGPSYVLSCGHAFAH